MEFCITFHLHWFMSTVTYLFDHYSFPGGQNTQQPVFGCPQGTVRIDSTSAYGARCPIEAPRCHPCVERRLQGRDQLRNLLEGQAGAIQDLCGARLQIGAPSTSHASCLLARSRDGRGASYQQDSGINSHACHEKTQAHTPTQLHGIPLRPGAAVRHFSNHTCSKNRCAWS